MPTVYARTLRRASEILGGEGELAFRLGVTPSHLAIWLSGTEMPPMEVFLKAVDVVTDQSMRETDA